MIDDDPQHLWLTRNERTLAALLSAGNQPVLSQRVRVFVAIRYSN